MIIHPIRSVLRCYFCGGRVVTTSLMTYRCEVEGVSWDMSEDLVLYKHGNGKGFPDWRARDPASGKFISVEA